MQTVFLALGSNVGDSRSHFDKAQALLAASVHDIERAPVYTSKAVGYTDQPDFSNTVLRGNTDLDPLALLAVIKDIEQQVGRIARFRWGPREIDIDIILYGDVIVDTADLQIPHVSFRDRDFVLKPLVDLAPELIDPVSGRTVQELLMALPPSELSILDETQ